MNDYVVSSCLVQRANEPQISTGVLFKILDQTNTYRVVVDQEGKIFDIYNKLVNEKNLHELSVWIKYLAILNDEKVFRFPISLGNYQNEIYLFLELVSVIRNEKKIIVNNHNSIPPEIKYILGKNEIVYNDHNILVYNSIEAINELKKYETIKIKNMKIEQKGNVNIGEGGTGHDIQTGNKNRISKRWDRQSILLGLALGILSSLIAAAIWYYFFPTQS